MRTDGTRIPALGKVTYALSRDDFVGFSQSCPAMTFPPKVLPPQDALQSPDPKPGMKQAFLCVNPDLT